MQGRQHRYQTLSAGELLDANLALIDSHCCEDWPPPSPQLSLTPAKLDATPAKLNVTPAQAGIYSHRPSLNADLYGKPIHGAQAFNRDISSRSSSIENEECNDAMTDRYGHTLHQGIICLLAGRRLTNALPLS
ncbi:hypothetical protein [Zhongshania sp.]|uniref:hypothetical protein n=1 Tax=Zhongshania sp. TaxID=1971902 RepID=UPI003569EF40